MQLKKRLFSALLALAVAAGAACLPSAAAGAAGTGASSAITANPPLDFPQFRGQSGSPGVTDAKTPLTAADIEEKWAVKYGSGWFANMGTPIVADDAVFVLAPSKSALLKLDKRTGEILAEGACPGGSQFFSIIGSGDGKIFVPRAAKVDKVSTAVIYAYDQETLEMVWQSAPLGEKAQPLSAIVYHNGHIYTGVSDGSAKVGGFYAFSTADDDPDKTDEVKQPAWTYAPESGAKGYYWSAAAIVGDAVAFAGEAGEVVLHSPDTDEVYARLSLPGEAGGVRSTAHYDRETGRLFLTSKGGYIHSVKINGDYTFDPASLISKKIGNDVTSSPLVFKGRVYVGGGGVQSTAGFSVLDADTLELIYGVDVKTQSSPVLTTAYATEENGWQVYLYVTQYERPSSLVLIADKQGQTTPDMTVLAEPSTVQYCTQSATIDRDGGIYYVNDSGNLFAFGHADPAKGLYTAADVDNAIGRLAASGPVQLADAFEVSRVKARFDGLDAAGQAAVTRGGELTAMLERLALLADEKAEAADIAAAIGALDPAAVTKDDAAALGALLARYNALSAEGQALVDNIGTLKAAIARVQELTDKAMAAELTAKIAALPEEAALCLDDKAAVQAVADLLAAQNASVKALVDATRLTALQTRLTAIEQAVTALNDRIFKDIQPLNVTLKDKETVEKLEAAYQAIGEKDRKHITGYDDVLYARKVIDGLLAGRVEADVFATIFGSDTRYTVPGVTPDGQSYTVAFTGTAITDPSLSFTMGLSFTSPHAAAIRRLSPDAVIFSFAHQGALPGPMTVEAPVSRADGTYTLYRYNAITGKAEAAGPVAVKNGTAVFTVTQGSDFFFGEAASASPDTGVASALPAAAVLALAGAALLYAVRRKR